MIATIVLEFEKITKFPLLKFLEEYKDFMSNSYKYINEYFSGKIETIDNAHVRALKKVTQDTATLMAQFKNFSNKFEKCGYWELMDFIDELNTNIEKINKLPKFRRTVLAKRGYTPNVEMKATVGSQRTIDDVANAINGYNVDNLSWVELMLNNDMNETDWEIDKLSELNVYINNSRSEIVTTIIDMPVGKRVYGVDIDCKIQFEQNDFKRVEYENNVEQKCNILLTLNKGDVPENTNFGKSPEFESGNIKTFNYPEIAREIQANFRQNDLFSSVSVKNISYDDNYNALLKVEIKTKYNYNTEKQVIL